MRTTIDISDDVLHSAKVLARLRNQSLGAVVSELARRGLSSTPRPKFQKRNGITTLVHGPGATPVTVEMVNQLLDAE